MTSKQQFEQFLHQHNIQYHIPSNIRNDDSIFESLYAICDRLVATNPSLLSNVNLKNLETLMKVAQDGLFFTGLFNETRLKN